MDPLQGKHHRGRVLSQDYKQHMRSRQSNLYLDGIPDDEYTVTPGGQFKCLVCHNLPPFSSGQSLSTHVKGKRHMMRMIEKKEVVSVKHDVAIPKKIPASSMSMPSLLYRTQEITKRVIAPEITRNKISTETNYISSNDKSNVVVFPFIPIISPSEEPMWRKKMLEEKEDEKMYEKGYRKDEEGKWYRDETVEFDSDE